jgi:hypothetical protein
MDGAQLQKEQWNGMTNDTVLVANILTVSPWDVE